MTAMGHSILMEKLLAKGHLLGVSVQQQKPVGVLKAAMPITAQGASIQTGKPKGWCVCRTSRIINFVGPQP
jgi:hypothetical protein